MRAPVHLSANVLRMILRVTRCRIHRLTTSARQLATQNSEQVASRYGKGPAILFGVFDGLSNMLVWMLRHVCNIIDSRNCADRGTAPGGRGAASSTDSVFEGGSLDDPGSRCPRTLVLRAEKTRPTVDYLMRMPPDMEPESVDGELQLVLPLTRFL